MELPASTFETIDWNQETQTEHPGASGLARWRTRVFGDVRIRLVEYSPGYLADHWCSRGHILLVLQGEIVSELEDGRSFVLTAGDSYYVSDDGDSPHRSHTATGAKLFIVD